MIKVDIPEEFKRKMRSTIYFRIYKAVEHSFCLKYCGPIIFKKLLSKEQYNNFILLHVACRLLSKENAYEYVERAKGYLKDFVEGAQDLYKDNFVLANIHNLLHICSDISYTRCNLIEMSAYQFEGYLGKMGRYMRSPNRLLAQYNHYY